MDGAVPTFGVVAPEILPPSKPSSFPPPVGNLIEGGVGADDGVVVGMFACDEMAALGREAEVTSLAFTTTALLFSVETDAVELLCGLGTL